MARIPTVVARNCVLKLEKLWDDWRQLVKSKHSIQDVESRRAQFSAMLDIGQAVGYCGRRRNSADTGQSAPR